MEEQDYRALAQLLRQRPQEGLAALIAQFGGPVRAICRSILRGHAQDAEEAEADTFVRLWKNAAALPDGGALPGYVVRTARSCAIDRYRRLARDKVVFPLDGREAGETELCSELERMLDSAAVTQAVLALGEVDGEMFLRRYLLCESVRDVAAHYGLSEAAVRTRMARARQKLQAALRKEGAV